MQFLSIFDVLSLKIEVGITQFLIYFYGML